MEQLVNATYKEHFTNQTAAEQYDTIEYARDSYSALLWELERDLLNGILGEFRRTHARIDYLDFAAGTGRVISFLEHKVEKALGIEISAAMAERANRRLTKGKVFCADVTAPAAPVEGAYDFITAVRFVLNAEPRLRIAALKALAARLRDETSWLVANNHGNLCSIKLLAWPYHHLRTLGQGWKPYGNYLSHAQMRQLIRGAGLKIVKVLGCGVLGGTVCQRLSYTRAIRLERRLSAGRFLQRFGQNQIYVLSRDSASADSATGA